MRLAMAYAEVHVNACSWVNFLRSKFEKGKFRYFEQHMGMHVPQNWWNIILRFPNKFQSGRLSKVLRNTPVTPTGDQPATAVRSWTLNIFTKRSEIAEKM